MKSQSSHLDLWKAKSNNFVVGLCQLWSSFKVFLRYHIPENEKDVYSVSTYEWTTLKRNTSGHGCDTMTIHKYCLCFHIQYITDSHIIHYLWLNRGTWNTAKSVVSISSGTPCGRTYKQKESNKRRKVSLNCKEVWCRNTTAMNTNCWKGNSQDSWGLPLQQHFHQIF